MEIHLAYGILSSGGIVRNYCDFSENWCGRSRRYYSYILATDRKPTLDVIVALAVRIDNLIDRFKQNNHLISMSELETLSRELWRCVGRRCILNIPKRRRPRTKVMSCNTTG